MRKVPEHFSPIPKRQGAAGHSAPARRAGARRPPRRGTATVELAVLLPLLAFILVVGVDWCRIYYTANTLDDCARSAAIAASGIAYQEYGLSDSQRESRARAEALKDGATLSPPLQASDVTVNTSGNYVTVTINYSFETITPYPGIGGTWPLTRSVRMPLLPQAPGSSDVSVSGPSGGSVPGSPGDSVSGSPDARGGRGKGGRR